MNDPACNELLELSWRRALTPEEEARLRSLLLELPEDEAEWADESRLNQALDLLPAAKPVSSNFTSQVLRRIERREEKKARAARPNWLQRLIANPWVPKFAIASVLLVSGYIAYSQHQITTRRAMVQSVADVCEVVTTPNPELMRDFEAINSLSSRQPKADTELLALLQ